MDQRDLKNLTIHDVQPHSRRPSPAAGPPLPPPQILRSHPPSNRVVLTCRAELTGATRKSTHARKSIHVAHSPASQHQRVVEGMWRGLSPEEACQEAIARLRSPPTAKIVFLLYQHTGLKKNRSKNEKKPHSSPHPQVSFTPKPESQTRISPTVRPRVLLSANLAHIRQSRPEYGPDFQVKPSTFSPLRSQAAGLPGYIIGAVHTTGVPRS